MSAHHWPSHLNRLCSWLALAWTRLACQPLDTFLGGHCVGVEILVGLGWCLVWDDGVILSDLG